MALSDLIIKQAKPRDKRYTLSDGRGLILEVHPNGRKYWVVRLWRDGKERRRFVGSFPKVPLKAARERTQGLLGALKGFVLGISGCSASGKIGEQNLTYSHE